MKKRTYEGHGDVYLGDCYDILPQLDIKMDMILADLPYNTLQSGWDTKMDLPKLWEQYESLRGDKTPVILTAQQPFATDLINSNRTEFRYEIIWEKSMKMGFPNANKMPLRAHENVLVFYKRLPTYNPKKYCIGRGNKRVRKHKITLYEGYSKGSSEECTYTDTGWRMPSSVIFISNWNGTLFGKKNPKHIHPTQKPVELFEYLIKTYTNEGDLVLDNTAGAMTTAIACVNTGRRFICIEKKEKFFNDGCNLLEEAIREYKIKKETPSLGTLFKELNDE